MAVLDPRIERSVRESFERQALMRTIGAAITKIEEGAVEISLAHDPALTQQNGFLHAAVVTAILDSAAGYAALSAMPPESDVLSVEFKVNLLAPARAERYVARSRVKRAGRMITVCEADAFALDGGSEMLIATLLGTMMRRAGEVR